MNEDLQELRRDVKTLKELMAGDLMKGTPGIAQNVLRVMNDLYQTPEGISPRLKHIEEWRLRSEARAAGAVWVLRFLWGGAFAVAGFAVKWLLK